MAQFPIIYPNATVPRMALRGTAAYSLYGLMPIFGPIGSSRHCGTVLRRLSAWPHVRYRNGAEPVSALRVNMLSRKPETSSYTTKKGSAAHNINKPGQALEGIDSRILRPKRHPSLCRIPPGASQPFLSETALLYRKT